MKPKSVGTIEVTGERIIVRENHCSTLGEGMTQSSFTAFPATVEGLQEAARVLAEWMDLSYSDRAKECQRIAANDQCRAELRSILEWYLHRAKARDRADEQQ